MPEPLSIYAYASLVSQYQDSLASSLRRSRYFATRLEFSKVVSRMQRSEAFNRYDQCTKWLIDNRPASMSFKTGASQLRLHPERVGAPPTDTSQDNGSLCPRSGGMPSDIKVLIDSIDMKQFAYPIHDIWRESRPEPRYPNGCDDRYKWYTFREMCRAERGYDYWLWPMSVLYKL